MGSGVLYLTQHNIFIKYNKNLIKIKNTLYNAYSYNYTFDDFFIGKTFYKKHKLINF